MATVGQSEKITQERVYKFFVDRLGYAGLGDLSGANNRTIRTGELEQFLFAYQGFEERDGGEALIRRAVARFERVANDASKSLYERNRAVYELLRYGVKVKPEVGAQTETVQLIDWERPERNQFAIAQEVTVAGASAKANTKRPDLVIYVNGIALGVLELKRSAVSVGDGIRQNRDNQRKEFIEPFFSTMQLVMAGNDTQGLRYGTIETTEKYYLEWKEEDARANAPTNPLDRALGQVCSKERFLEIIHDFIVFDAGTKKLCRHNQYFGVKAAQKYAQRREGGIIWHTQGSGKSLTMVWLAKWIREHIDDSRVLIITDRVELDAQIEKVFKGVDEQIVRAESGADLINRLNKTEDWLLCSLIHKFGTKEDDTLEAYLAEIKKAVTGQFEAKGELFVFVDECHRTQSGTLHEAMKAILPEATFIGFTGTPLLKADKKSIEVFGEYIHTYKFREAVRDGVILDLRYEARDIDQRLDSPEKVDQWFQANTRGLTRIARARLRQRWGQMREVLSSDARLRKIVQDILLDMGTRERLQNGHGNAMLVAGSIYEACKFYDIFAERGFKKCAVVTSYEPHISDIKGEDSGEGNTDAVTKYASYRRMLADWFDVAPNQAIKKTAEFERAVKKMFVEQPGQMKLLIVVDKLLTGFDAPSATYLYIDKKMRDHGLFQAICRVNRLDGESKAYGYIVDYQDLFKNLEGAIRDYTSGALDGYDKEDIDGLLVDRLEKARERLEEALEQIRALCEPVEPPRAQEDFLRYFSVKDPKDAARFKESEAKRLYLYKYTSALVRAYADLANEMEDAGYSPGEAAAIKEEVRHFEELRAAIKQHSGDAIDLKRYEPAMRGLIDAYIAADESTKVSEGIEELSLLDLIVERGPDAVDALAPGIQKVPQAVNETIENNVRKLIVDESPINPKYYEKMSTLLDALIEERKRGALDYAKYLHKIIAFAQEVKQGGRAADYPPALDNPTKRAIFDNLDGDEALALQIDQAVRTSIQDGWRGHKIKTRMVKRALEDVLANDDERVDQMLELAMSQDDY